VSIRVQLPPLLRPIMGGERFLSAEGNSIGAVLSDLARRNPELALHFFNESGGIRHNIVFLHEGTMIRAKEADLHKLKPGDEIVITNALAGG
jgi:molybdopterin synthase sulfur carrier subunit